MASFPVRVGLAVAMRSCHIVIASLLRERGETGIQTHVNQVRAYLAEQGRPASFVNHFSCLYPISAPIYALRRLIDPLSGTLSVWWYRYWHYVFLRLALNRVLADGRELVIYAQGPLDAKAALEARRTPRQRVVMAVHFYRSQAYEWAMKGRLRPDGGLYRGIERLEAEVLTRVDGLVYISRFIKDYLESRHPALASVPSVIVPNFVSSAGRDGWLEARRDLISIGALEPHKNQQYLLRVLAEVAARDRRYTLTIVGDGPDRAMLERTAEELGLAEQVQFLGYLPNAARLLAGHRVYVHSALAENLPLVVIEALSHGLPVLAANVGGVSELIDEGREGLFWPLDDPREGAERLISLLETPDLYAAMARHAVERVATSFDAAVVAKRLVGFLCGDSDGA